MSIFHALRGAPHLALPPGTVIVFLIASWAWGQTPPQPREAPRDSLPPTAEDILSALRQARPANDVIPSDHWRVQPDAARRKALLPEGLRILNLVGQLDRDADGWVFRARPDQSYSAFRLLPNRCLDQMVRASRGAGTPLLFSVSGEVTVFKGENYLFPRVAARYNHPVPPSPASPTVDQEPPLPVDAAADDVLLRLRAQQPEHEVLDSATTLQAPVEAITDRAEGMPLIQRSGRIWGRGTQWTFTLESTGGSASEASLNVLPNQHLERMIDAVETSTMPLVFLISGEVTVFDDRPHVLIRAVNRRSASGDFGK